MKFRKLIALVLSLVVMSALAVVPSFATTPSTKDIEAWAKKNITVGADDAANINNRNAKGIRTCTKVYQTFRYTQEAHPISGQGCFSITKGVMLQGKKKTDIYLVAAHGLETSAYGQEDDLQSCLNAGTEKTSVYLKAFLKLIKKNVPKDANVILAGHSLGGMVAQQAAANKSMQKRYNILHVVTWGSPLLSKGKTEGTVHRMCEANDVVPYLSVYTFNDLDAQKNDRNSEKADVIPVIQSHVDGYNDTNAWKDYDAIGVKRGKTVLKMNDNTTKRFYAVKDGKQVKGSAWVAFNNKGNWQGVSVLY